MLPLARSPLLRHAGIYLFGDLLVRSGSLLLVPLYTRTLTLDDYGAVAIASLVATVVSYLAGVSLSAAIIKLDPEFQRSGQPGRVVNSVGKFVVLWSIALCALLLAMAPFLTAFLFKSEGLLPYVRAAIVIGCFSGITNTLLAIFQSREQPIKYRIVTLVSFFGNVATGFVAVVVLKSGGIGAIAGQLVGAACGCLVALLSVRIDYRSPYDKAVVAKAIRVGIPLTVYSFGGFSTDHLSRLFIERDISAAALAVFSIGVLYCTSVAMVFASINTAWVPRFFQLPRAEIAERSEVYGSSVIIGAIAMGGVMVLLAPPILGFAVGRSYRGAADYVPLLMINAILAGPVWSLFMNPLVLAGRNWCIAWCAVASGVCNLLLNLMLTPRFGAWGAGFSSTVSLVVLTALIARYSLKAYPVKFNRGAIGEIALAVSLAYILANVPGLTVNNDNLLRVALALVCAALGYRILYRQLRRGAPVVN